MDMGRGLRYLLRLAGFILFAGYFFWELVVANFRVTVDVLTPRHRFRPRIIAVPMAARSDLEILILGNLISLTPGTLTVDVNREKGILYVHASYAADAEAIVRQIKDGFEERLLRLLR